MLSLLVELMIHDEYYIFEDIVNSRRVCSHFEIDELFLISYEVYVLLLLLTYDNILPYKYTF